MAEFLVNVEVSWPDHVSEERRQELRKAQLASAKALAAAGMLVRMWRIPGRPANWALWNATDASELHQAISGMPIWPYMSVHVTALANHPIDPASWEPE